MTQKRNEPSPWHALPIAEVWTRLAATAQGLSTELVTERLARFGPNRIEQIRPDGPLKVLWRQINNPLLWVLIVSGTAATLMGKVTDGVVVLGVVVINTAIGVAQELQASRAIASLLEMVPSLATVLRDNKQLTLPAVELVPGDVILVGPGEKIPADIRLVHTKNLLVEEAALTGESAAVSKQSSPVEVEAVLGDRTSMSFAGTLVAAGFGTGVVVATGNDTQLGKISGMLRQAPTLETPLTQSMATVSKWLTLAILAVTGALFAVGLARGYLLADATIAAISLAVAAIPEGLPAIVTIALAIGVRRMAKRQVIIRQLPAVETLGSTTVICTDKTGTLTRNEMTVQGLWTPDGAYQLSGVGYAPEGDLRSNNRTVETVPESVSELIRAAALCNDASVSPMADGRWQASGDPTEVALVVAARKLGHTENELRTAFPRVDTLPFSSETQLMATLNQAPNTQHVILVKGAPEAILARCQRLADGSPVSLPVVQGEVDSLAGQGMRVLAVARKHLAQPLTELTEADLEGELELLGLQAMIDPPRPEAVEAIRQCQTAGIDVKMVTGDHRLTAQAIANELGLAAQGPAATGVELEAMTDAELRSIANASNVFARVAPETKFRLVQALQEDGQIVAMTGDGVNDAPALKTANIGVAMGLAGTSVAKEAADMVLTDDNFASIAGAVEEGRRVFDNLVKSLAFVLPTNIGEALIILIAVLSFPIIDGAPIVPILPVQILWVNLVATVALALPLAFEALEPDVMKRPPRDPQSPILGGFLLVRTGYVAVLLTAVALGLFLMEFDLNQPNTGDALRPIAEAQTMAVTAIILFQVFYLFDCRSLQRSVLDIGFFSNKAVFYGVALILLLQVGFVYLPFMNELFGTTPIGLVDWLKSAAAGSLIIPFIAAEKWIRRLQGRSHGESRASASRAPC